MGGRIEQHDEGSERATLIGLDWGTSSLRAFLFDAQGRITPENMAVYRDAGADGFGLGSALYRAGDDADTVERKARAFFVAWEHALT